MKTRVPLPIDAQLEEITDAVRLHGAVVLLAPPGAGKTTRVPPTLLDAGLFGEETILVLQPRRVAARTTARRIASERGEEIGETIGYRVRFENKVSARTRVEVVTEGLLTRRLQRDPFLEGIGCVIFDEFHERSLNADLALALVREIQRDVRPELKIVVMSATLDPGPVSAWLQAPTISVPGRTFPVEITYDPSPSKQRTPERVSAAIRQALKEHSLGHVLAFLPGVGEINRCLDLLGTLDDIDVMPLHGRLSARDQDRVFTQSKRRKVILSTNIAETSVTIDGVRVVIDSGLERQPRFDRAIGLERLETVHISRASADQRAGRAGRTAPGVCRRLWTESAHRGLAPSTRPEVHRVDLSRTFLEVQAWGTTPEEFDWFEAPPIEVLNLARDLLQTLGAIDNSGITQLGRQMVDLPLPPRISRVLLSAINTEELTTVASIAALVTERDLFFETPDLTGESDLALRLDALNAHLQGRRQRGVSQRAADNLIRVRDQLLRSLGVKPQRGALATTIDDATPHLLMAFPDRVAQRRQANSERFLLANGQGARLSPRSVVRRADTILAVSIRGAIRGERAEHVIDLATSIDPALLDTKEDDELTWDAERESVRRARVQRFGALVLGKVPASGPAVPEDVGAVLAAEACKDPEHAFGLDKRPGLRSFVDRVEWLRAERPSLDLPNFDLFAPSEYPTQELLALCVNGRSFGDLRGMDVLGYLKGLMGYGLCAEVDRLAPERITLPDGTEKRLQYRQDGPPILATRFERLFGLNQTPSVAGVPISLHLLAPNMRPVQVTSDLPGFWACTYAEVRKELRGRYPKHPWPEDPMTAKPGIHRRPRRS
jgi:ATP-dependent helicase HrpB